jgi:hypothetical protein
MKIASSKHDLLWYIELSHSDPNIHSSDSETYFLVTYSSLSDADAAHFHISPTDKADFIEEIITEISVYLGMLYHLIEVFKGHDEFADELSWYCFHNGELVSLIFLGMFVVSLEPPLPVYLFNVVAGLRDKSAKGYPIKKVCAHHLIL